MTVTVTGLTLAPSPDVGLTETVRATEPENPFRLPRVSVEEVDCPAFKVAFVRLEERLKSTTCTITWAAWIRDPLVPVMVTV